MYDTAVHPSNSTASMMPMLHFPGGGDELGTHKYIPGSRARTFTPRQIEIMRWIAKGKSDWQIAQILFISNKTVNYHVERAKQKLRVTTRTQAVLVADHLGLL